MRNGYTDYLLYTWTTTREVEAHFLAKIIQKMSNRLISRQPVTLNHTDTLSFHVTWTNQPVQHTHSLLLQAIRCQCYLFQSIYVLINSQDFSLFSTVNTCINPKVATFIYLELISQHGTYMYSEVGKNGGVNVAKC